jgi:Zn-dependent peptidase ImmA (M78 family)
MVYKNYSPEQLECAAEQLLNKFDPELLKSPKEYDVYAVIEKCLGVDYGWQYIRPDQKILGLTAFNDGYIYVSPTPYVYEGIKPKQIHLSKGEIVIDSTLTEGNNRGRENFTVLHEVAHQVLHKESFCEYSPSYILQMSDNSLRANSLRPEEKHLLAARDHIERQANTFAAAFLMPRQTVPETWRKISGYAHRIPERLLSEHLLKTLADEYQSSKQAMLYRMYHLGLVIPEGLS